MIIAIDGPAAAGKGTLAQRLAAHYGLPHLDTGLLYRLVGKIVAGEVDNDQTLEWLAASAVSISTSMA